MKLKATLVLLLALTGGAGVFTWRVVRNGAEPAVREPELRWLQREFALSDDAMLRIAELHRRYTAECEPMCAALEASNAEIRRLMIDSKQMAPELGYALNRSNEIVGECRHRMIRHFYAVAQEMPPAASQRYLQLMTSMAVHPEQGWLKIGP